MRKLTIGHWIAIAAIAAIPTLVGTAVVRSVAAAVTEHNELIAKIESHLASIQATQTEFATNQERTEEHLEGFRLRLDAFEHGDDSHIVGIGTRLDRINAMLERLIELHSEGR